MTFVIAVGIEGSSLGSCRPRSCITSCPFLQGSKKTVLEGIISFFNQLDKRLKEEQKVPQ